MSTISLPGLIDCHVHFREPGGEHKATMETESRAALAGGITTVCEMPNTDPPTVSIEVFRYKVERASAIPDCDIRFFFGATKLSHLGELKDLWTSPSHSFLKARCAGLKLYFDHSTGNQGAGEEVIEKAFALASDLSIPLVGHCEDPKINADAEALCTDTSVAAHSIRRPPEAEAKAVERAIGLARQYGCPFHIAHLSTGDALDLIRGAKGEGIPITCEVAPHHLFFTVDDYVDLGTLIKINPPIRPREHTEALWEGIADGTVDCIATDHSPHTLKEKKAQPPLSCPSGFPEIETNIPLLLSVCADHWPHPQSERPKHAYLTHEDIMRLCFENPNRIFALGKNKDDVSITIDPIKEWVIRGEELHSKCGWTPYEGWKVVGRVEYPSST
jgi:dihydroorotase